MSDLYEKNIFIMDVPKPLSCLMSSDTKQEREREREGYNICSSHSVNCMELRVRGKRNNNIFILRNGKPGNP